MIPMADTTARTPAATATADLTPGHWVFDPTRSTISIEHSAMWGLVTAKGVFTEVSGNAVIPPGGPAHGSLQIEAGSVDTKNAKRDTHLRSADFFDAENYPSITFNVISAVPGSDGTVAIKGELTVLDSTRPLDFTAQASEMTAAAVTLNANVPVNREDFGMNWNKLGMMKAVTLVTITARFTRQPG
jgi:polyisoprenoid-binding protein YceI